MRVLWEHSNRRCISVVSMFHSQGKLKDSVIQNVHVIHFITVDVALFGGHLLLQLLSLNTLM